MGRHGAEQDDGQPRARDTGTRHGDLGPVTDPFLLDAMPVRPRRERDARPAADDAPDAVEPARPAGRAERPRAEVSPAPWAPRPVLRRTETPFSGPIALPDPDEPVVQVSSVQPPTALHDPAHAARPPTPPRPAPGSAPDRTAPEPLDGPRSLPALVGEAPRPTVTPAATDAATDDLEDPIGPEAVGLSGRTLLLSVGVGVLVSAALSILAILPR